MPLPQGCKSLPQGCKPLPQIWVLFLLALFSPGAEAYDSDEVVVVDKASLAELDDAQLRELLEFTGSCGRVLLVDVPIAIEEVFRNRAACGGRYLATIKTSGGASSPDQSRLEAAPTDTSSPDLSRLEAAPTDTSSPDQSRLEAAPTDTSSPDQSRLEAAPTDTSNPDLSRLEAAPTGAPQISALARQLAELPPAERATDEQLEALLDEGTTDVQPSRFVIFVTAYLLLLGILLVNARTRTTALGFSVIATLVVHFVWPPASTRSFVAWAEAGTHEQVAAYRSLERYRTYRDGNFKREETWTLGSFAVHPILEIAQQNGDVVLCNAGAGTSETTHIAWLGELFAVPPLAPGETWTSDNALAVNPGAPELVIFQDRSSGHDLALLRPLPIAAAVGDAWLLRHGLPQEGGTSCEN